MTNQWMAGNRYRSYPFEQNAALPFPDTVVVGANVVLATAFNVTDVTLTSVVAGSGTLTLTFSIGSTSLTGYTLTGIISTTAAEEARIPLVLKQGGTPYPNLGYGFLMIGQPADAAVGSASGLTAVLDRSSIRYNVAGQPLVLRVANTLRLGGSTVSYTPGSPTVLSVQGLVAGIESECIERAATPTSEQEEVLPNVRGTTTSLVPVPSPAGLHTVLTAGSVTTITTTPAQQTTTLPTLPTDRDADVETGVVPSTVVLTAGYNVKLSGDIATNTVQLNYQLAAGCGMDCSGILGYSSVTKSSQCVKSVNGVYPTGQQLQLVAAAGIAILSDQVGHQLIVLVNPLNLTRVAP